MAADGKDRVEDRIKGVKVTEDPLKYRLFQWLRENPHERSRGYLRKAAIELGINYKENREVLWTYSSQFKTDIRSLTDYEQRSRKTVCSNPDSQHCVHAEAAAPSCLDRKKYPDVTKLAAESGWRLSKNKNRILIWEQDAFRLGRVQWWETGKILVHVVKPKTLGRAKQLIYNAFMNTGLIADVKISEPFLANVRWYSSHDVYFYDKVLPYKKITAYEQLGVKSIVTGDFSHRKGLEVEVIKPDIVSKFENLLDLLAKSFNRSELEKAGIAKILESNTAAIQSFNTYLQDISTSKKPQGKLERLYE